MPSNLWRAISFSLLCALAFPHNKAIIFLTEDIEFSEILQTSYPTFSFLREKANWGLISTRRSRLEEIIGGISGGDYPLVSAKEAPLGFNAKEKVGDIEARYVVYSRTGILPPEEGVVQVAIESIKALNEKKKKRPIVGLLGSLLRTMGFKTAVVGNSDGEEPRRLGVLLACDQNGIVDMGDVSRKLLREEPLSAGGKVIDLQKLRKTLERFKSASFIVIDSGEMGRFSQYEPFLSPQAKLIWREDAIRRVDTLLGEALKIYRKGDLFLFLSLIGSRRDKPDRLSPIALLSEKAQGGLLTSPSTHWKGLVHLPDITATILNFFNIPLPSSLRGSPLETTEGKLEELLELSQASALSASAQPFLIALALSFYLLGFLLLIFRITPHILILSLLLPSTLYLTSFFYPQTVPLYLLIAFLLCLSLFLLLWSICQLIPFPLPRLTITFIAGSIIIDMLSGGKLSSQSPLSIYAMGGCRFYGVGNEYGGILLASLPFALYFLSPREGGVLCGLFISALLMGLPLFGANLGVSLSLFALCILVAYQMRKKKGLLLALGIFLLMAVFLGTIALLSESHIRSFIQLLIEGSPQSFLIVRDKILLNFSIASETAWKAGMLTLAGLFILALLRGIRVREETAGLFLPTLGSIIVAFFLNDTGAILALFALQYLLAIFLLEGYESLRN